VSNGSEPAFAPRNVTLLLRLEGVALLVASLVAYAALGGNWWLFLLLILVPDLCMLAKLSGSDKLLADVYNLAHTTVIPLAIGVIAYFAGWMDALPYCVIWLAHIAADRALGFGLKYPGSFRATHLGAIGKKA
jgi:hypothetical protein